MKRAIPGCALVLLAAVFVGQTSVGSRRRSRRRRRISCSSRRTTSATAISARTGRRDSQTPSLDRLAREGIRFTQYYAGSTVCAPSRTALMTGLAHRSHLDSRQRRVPRRRPAPRRGRDHRRGAARRRLPDRRSSASGGWACRAPPACPTSRASTTRSASSISGTRTGSSPITSIATASASRPISSSDYVNDLFTREAAAFIERDDRAAVLPLPELHGAARRAARAGGFDGADARQVPGEAVRESQGRRQARAAPARTLPRSAIDRSRRRRPRSPR